MVLLKQMSTALGAGVLTQRSRGAWGLIRSEIVFIIKPSSFLKYGDLVQK